jgi:hypothetical protein
MNYIKNIIKYLFIHYHFCFKVINRTSFYRGLFNGEWIPKLFKDYVSSAEII